MKLPILYLIDSIVKNVGGVYIKYFSQSLVQIFTGAFEKVNTSYMALFIIYREKNYEDVL